MATNLYQTNGAVVPITPANGVHWTLEELQALVGGYIEMCRTNDGKWMVVNELGKVVDTKEEMDRPKDDDEDDNG